MITTYIELAIAIISLIFTVISTYFSFKQSNSDPTYTDQRILQINPIYFVTNNCSIEHTDEQSVNNQNKSFIANSLFTFHMIVIGIYYIYQLMECTDNGNSIYTATIRTIILISVINIFYSLFVLLFFINKRCTILKNIIAMKHYSLKIITDTFLIIICSVLLTENFINDSILLLNMSSISFFAYMFQITWFFFTLQKSFKLIKPTKLYKEMLMRLILYVPSYIIPFIMIFIFLKNII